MAFVISLIGEIIFLSAFTDWSFLATLTASLALTTTSVAVVYSVLMEHELKT